MIGDRFGDCQPETRSLIACSIAAVLRRDPQATGHRDANRNGELAAAGVPCGCLARDSRRSRAIPLTVNLVVYAAGLTNSLTNRSRHGEPFCTHETGRASPAVSGSTHQRLTNTGLVRSRLRERSLLSGDFTNVPRESDGLLAASTGPGSHPTFREALPPAALFLATVCTRSHGAIDAPRAWLTAALKRAFGSMRHGRGCGVRRRRGGGRSWPCGRCSRSPT